MKKKVKEEREYVGKKNKKKWEFEWMRRKRRWGEKNKFVNYAYPQKWWEMVNNQVGGIQNYSSNESCVPDAYVSFHSYSFVLYHQTKHHLSAIAGIKLILMMAAIK